MCLPFTYLMLLNVTKTISQAFPLFFLHTSSDEKLEAGTTWDYIMCWYCYQCILCSSCTVAMCQISLVKRFNVCYSLISSAAV